CSFCSITEHEGRIIQNRSHDSIIREIEEKILTHPAISEVAVLGVPDRKWGEVGWAICVCRPGESATEDEVKDFLADRISGYKRPHRVLFWPELPKSAYGKITKKLIREALEAQSLLDRA
ncbi:MAG TPA: acyl-CoA synthetase, partial [Paracoccus sp.]|nr:acyl-CoA synthetase [Paracoccus sp. (in: a-proteobacteria)]